MQRNCFKKPKKKKKPKTKRNRNTPSNQKTTLKLNMVAHAYNPSNREVEGKDPEFKVIPSYKYLVGG